MLKVGDKVKFSQAEKEMVETFAGESIAPETADDAKAWLAKAAENADETSPEERLMAAVFKNMADEIGK